MFVISAVNGSELKPPALDGCLRQPTEEAPAKRTLHAKKNDTFVISP
jgi:hypothetical protein